MARTIALHFRTSCIVVLVLLLLATLACAGSILDGIDELEADAYEALGKTATTLWNLQASFVKAERILLDFRFRQDQELLSMVHRMLDNYANLAKGYNEIHALYDFRFSDVARIPEHQKYGVLPRTFNPYPPTRFLKPQA